MLYKFHDFIVVYTLYVMYVSFDESHRHQMGESGAMENENTYTHRSLVYCVGSFCKHLISCLKIQQSAYLQLRLYIYITSIDK